MKNNRKCNFIKISFVITVEQGVILAQTLQFIQNSRYIFIEETEVLKNSDISKEYINNLHILNKSIKFELKINAS